MSMNRSFPSGIKKTKQRTMVFDALCAAKQPVNAMDILSVLDKNNLKISLSTVYRILEMFTDRGIVVKLGPLNGKMTVFELANSTHLHYAVCIGCNKIVAMDNCPLKEFEPEFSDSGFYVTGHKVEMFGYCAVCAKARI